MLGWMINLLGPELFRVTGKKSLDLWTVDRIHYLNANLDQIMENVVYSNHLGRSHTAITVLVVCHSIYPLPLAFPLWTGYVHIIG
jgi:hypothetical protein